jgi:hypothetical protein
MKEKLEELIKEVESKINPEFDFEVEHWENGNFDDSYSYGVVVGEEYAYIYSYGVVVGEEYAYRELLVKLKKLHSEL